MNTIACYMIMFGGGSLLLNMIGIDFIIVSWMPTWGKVTTLILGIIIFIALAIVDASKSETGKN
jgi:hypothetical protein